MGDITKVSESRNKDDGGDWDEWPYPTVTIESEISGELRTQILGKLGVGEGRVTITETEVSGGYSEYTQETDYGIEAFINGASVWSHDSAAGSDSAMSAFLNWVKD